MDDDCKQQVPSVAVRLQQLTTQLSETAIMLGLQCGVTPSQTGGRINIYTYFVVETRISPWDGVWEDQNVVTESVMPCQLIK